MKTKDREYEENKFLLDQIENEFIRKRISQSFRWHNDRAVFAKKCFYGCSVFTVLCPTASTVVLLLPSGAAVKLISAILMAISTCMAACLTLFDLRNKWGIYRNQAEEIKAMLAQHLIDHAESEEDLLQKIEESMRTSHAQWQKCFDKNAPQQDKLLHT